MKEERKFRLGRNQHRVILKVDGTEAIAEFAVGYEDLAAKAVEFLNQQSCTKEEKTGIQTVHIDMSNMSKSSFERIYTESEVKELIKEFDKWIDKSTWYNEGGWWFDERETMKSMWALFEYFLINSNQNKMEQETLPIEPIAAAYHAGVRFEKERAQPLITEMLEALKGGIHLAEESFDKMPEWYKKATEIRAKAEQFLKQQ